MISLWLGDLPLGSNALTGPTGNTIERTNTFAQYDVTRGKPVLHDIGAELDTQTLDFFFSEEFCNVPLQKAALEAAFALKTPMPLVFANGVYLGKRYVVETLSMTIVKTDRSGGPVRIEATIGLLESPQTSLLGLLSSIAKGRAPALKGRAKTNPNARK